MYTYNYTGKYALNLINKFNWNIIASEEIFLQFLCNKIELKWMLKFLIVIRMCWLITSFKNLLRFF